MRHTVVLGDCHEVLPTIDTGTVDLVVTDPPWVLTGEAWDAEDVFDASVVSELHRVTKPSASVYVWCGLGEKSQSLLSWWALLANKFHFMDIITWKKRRGLGNRRGWLYTREEVLWFVRDRRGYVWNRDKQYGTEPNQFKFGFNGHPCKSAFKRITNVWTDIPETLGAKGVAHFTPKPLPAIERIIAAHTEGEGVVLDPFLGSGTTVLAADRCGCRGAGIEKALDYEALLRERLAGLSVEFVRHASAAWLGEKAIA